MTNRRRRCSSMISCSRIGSTNHGAHDESPVVARTAARRLRAHAMRRRSPSGGRRSRRSRSSQTSPAPCRRAALRRLRELAIERGRRGNDQCRLAETAARTRRARANERRRHEHAWLWQLVERGRDISREQRAAGMHGHVRQSAAAGCSSSSPYMCCGGTVATIQGLCASSTGPARAAWSARCSAELPMKLRQSFMCACGVPVLPEVKPSRRADRRAIEGDIRRVHPCGRPPAAVCRIRQYASDSCRRAHCRHFLDNAFRA